mgnify:FL=1
MAKSITSANSVLVITAASRGVADSISGSTGISSLGTLSGLIGVPQQIEGWSADNAFSIDAQQTAMVVQGVDGKTHFGWVPHLVPFNVSLMPDSDSQDYLENLVTAQDLMRETLMITGTLIIPAISKKYSLTNGALTSYTPIPSHQRVLAAQGMTITFSSITPAAY